VIPEEAVEKEPTSSLQFLYLQLACHMIASNDIFGEKRRPVKGNGLPKE
jgi:hypothetical protein